MAEVMANSPALVKGWLALSGALSEGVIPAPVRERLAVATARYNNCEYCLSAHIYIGAHVAKVDAEELERARDAESSDPHTALLVLAAAIARDRGSNDEAQLKAARGAGVCRDGRGRGQSGAGHPDQLLRPTRRPTTSGRSSPCAFT
jgi:AhpD family alkylhydroperoxidase